MNKVLKVILGWAIIIPLTFLFCVMGQLLFPSYPDGGVILGGVLLLGFMIWFGIIRIEYLVQNPKGKEGE